MIYDVINECLEIVVELVYKSKINQNNNMINWFMGIHVILHEFFLYRCQIGNSL